MTDDLISRADAIEALEKAKERYFDRAVIIARMQDILRAIPSAQSKTIDAYTRGWTDGADAVKAMPQPKQGYWIYTDRTNVYGGREITCSECGDSFMISPKIQEDLYEYERYCRFCGARMNSSEKPNNCETCANGEGDIEACGYCRHGDLYEPKDEPQTERSRR